MGRAPCQCGGRAVVMEGGQASSSAGRVGSRTARTGGYGVRQAGQGGLMKGNNEGEEGGIGIASRRRARPVGTGRGVLPAQRGASAVGL